jgi:hypothetical protein
LLSSTRARTETQLLLGEKSLKPACGFLEKIGRADAIAPYVAFIRRMPKGWFACYVGAFAGRPDTTLRVECIPSHALTRAYAQDATLLQEHLATKVAS